MMNNSDPAIRTVGLPMADDTFCLVMPVAYGLVLSVAMRRDYGVMESVRLYDTRNGERVCVDMFAFGRECPECESFADLKTLMELAEEFAISHDFEALDF